MIALPCKVGNSHFAINLLGVSNVDVSANASAGVTGAGEVCSFRILDDDSSGRSRNRRRDRLLGLISDNSYMIKKRTFIISLIAVAILVCCINPSSAFVA